MAHLRHLAYQSPSVRPPAATMARLARVDPGWSPDVLGDFSLRMGSHGLSVSSTMMQRDPLYALEQLQHAHNLPDDDLRALAHVLARRFEQAREAVAELN
ncbi:hypothetical protein JI739_15855 [Ramlibacter sp. AW1]|uniref:Uncharacterized protein n=1 Tax=Ramlibacter aurantiacus TaxID=2801330 RepID=A0A936ZI22_9BURK|nr:hypothetical protein [Ramlibacter aurantiacus]MBL0421824.1 hypothetical protein [Ramlibacter aurantiacus]